VSKTSISITAKVSGIKSFSDRTGLAGFDSECETMPLKLFAGRVSVQPSLS